MIFTALTIGAVCGKKSNQSWLHPNLRLVEENQLSLNIQRPYLQLLEFLRKRELEPPAYKV